MNLRKIGMLAAILVAALGLSGCMTGKGSVYSQNLGPTGTHGKGVAQDSGTEVATVKTGSGVTLDVATLDVNRGQKMVVAVVSKPGLFHPSIIAAGVTICKTDPYCPEMTALAGGTGEPFANVLLNTAGNIFSGSFTPTSTISNVAFGGAASATGGNAKATAYGGEGGSATVNNKVTNKVKVKVHNKVTVNNGGDKPKPPKPGHHPKPCYGNNCKG